MGAGMGACASAETPRQAAGLRTAFDSQGNSILSKHSKEAQQQEVISAQADSSLLRTPATLPPVTPLNRTADQSPFAYV